MASINYEEAAHLLRRAGFGGSPEDINGLVARGREGAVDFLVNYESIDNSALDALLFKSFGNENFRLPSDIQRWWLTRMIHTRRPFEEKMTFFWHNHFATSYFKAFYPYMAIQNKTLRRHALDRFDTLLVKVAEDPAMLIWLDGVLNLKVSPNENFARELQELFTMGITDMVTGEANYTEKDVKEIARCFTGYTIKVKRKKIYKSKFRFDPAQHDNTAKEVYGQTANFTGEDIVTLIAARRATPRFLVKKLFEFFVYPLTSSAEDTATIEKFSDIYISSNHSIKSLVRAIFVSDEFFSGRARFALIKNPLEYIVSAIRCLGATYNVGTDTRPDFTLITRARQMGLELLNPRDVNGWDLNLGWLNTSNMLERYNFANYFASNRETNPDAAGAWLTNDQLRRLTEPTAEATVRKLLTMLGPLKTDAQTVAVLTNYLETDDQGNRVGFTVNDATLDKSVRGLIHLMLCLQEFHLN
ncbi:MAG TPA: DUF1800 domain-containing protein [Blastocatellia bacterium]|nr:DUF1800 domain-containing protein [Blastocatellia bacterium]